MGQAPLCGQGGRLCPRQAFPHRQAQNKRANEDPQMLADWLDTTSLEFGNRAADLAYKGADYDSLTALCAEFSHKARIYIVEVRVSEILQCRQLVCPRENGPRSNWRRLPSQPMHSTTASTLTSFAASGKTAIAAYSRQGWQAWALN